MNAFGKHVVDFKRLAKRLAAQACVFLNFFGEDSRTRVVDGLGKSAVDFAADTILLFVEGSVACTGDDDAIFACLRRVMERDILDAVRSKTVKTTTKLPTLTGNVSGDGAPQPSLDDFASGDDIARTVEQDVYKERLYAVLKDVEPELFDFVYAVCEFNALTPREIAEVVGTCNEDIYNRKKRLRTYIAQNGLMGLLPKASV